MSIIENNLKEIYTNMECALKKTNRTLADATLVGVTKNIDVDTIKILLDQGVKTLGENRVQEFLPKYEALKEQDITWHFIGNLQTNKVKYIIDKVDLIQSVNSTRLADEINKQAKKINKVQDILLEINISEEESKIGMDKTEVDIFINHIQNLHNIRLKGLMTIAPNVKETGELREYFRCLEEKFIDIRQICSHNIKMQYLSMGMTGDYDIALESGANMIRIGSGIFY